MTRWSGTARVLFGVAVLAVASAGVGAYFLHATPTNQSIQVRLTISQDEFGLFIYNETSIRVPSNSLVEFMITNFDTNHHPAASGFANVTGTQSGTMTEAFGWTQEGTLAGQSVSGIPPSTLSQTFTMIGNGYDLNVPIPSAVGPGQPSIVSFSIETYGHGETTWVCETAQTDLGYQLTGLTGVVWTS